MHRVRLVVVLLLPAVVAAARSGARKTAAPPAAVAVASEKEFIHEISVAVDFKRHTWGPFHVMDGVRVPFEGFWQRYEPFVGIPISELLLAGPPRPSPVALHGKVYDFQQVHGGYPVSGYGYSLEVVGGYVRWGLGKTMTGLPDRLPTPITADRALAIALEQVQPKVARPWLTDPQHLHPPTSTLMLWSSMVDPTGADPGLVYTFDFSGTGVFEPHTLIIDAETGAVLRATRSAIVR